MFNRLCAGLLGHALLVSVHAAPPSLGSIYPPGGQVGTTMEFQVGSKLDPWPMDLWTSHDGIVVKALEANGRFKATIGKDVPAGPQMMCLVSSKGVSNVKWFVVGADPELLELEAANDHWQDAQSISNFPVVINGWLSKQGDVDTYAVDLASNQTLQVETEAYTIDAGIDPLLYLLDAKGLRIAHVHDTRKLDPVLVHQAERAGRVYVQVAGFKNPPSADIRFHGAVDVRYRLRFSHERPSEPGSRFEQGLVEPERLTFPMTLTGSLKKPREEDPYAFEAKKGAHYLFTPLAEGAGSAMDPYLSILDEGNKVLAKVDDTKAKQPDAPLAWTATKDGMMRLGIRDALYRHGPAFVYQLQAETGVPGLRAQTESDVLVLEAGQSVDLKLQVDRVFGEARAWVVVAHGLPAGVRATSAELRAKGGEVQLTLEADDKATVGSTRIHVAVTSLDPDAPMVLPVVVKLKGQSTPHEDLHPNTVDHLWLTITPKPKPPILKAK